MPQKIVESQILNTLELFLYAYRYRNTRLILALDSGISITQLLDGLRALRLAHISCIVLCREQANLSEDLNRLSRRGSALRLAGSLNQDSAQTASTCIDLLEQEEIPVVSVATVADNQQFWESAFSLAKTLEARKLFILSDTACFESEGNQRSLVKTDELADLLAKSSNFNVDRYLLELTLRHLEQGHGDVALLEASSTCLYQEIFTHGGCGTLFTGEQLSEVRQAKLSDVLEIHNLMKPYAATGAVIPITEDEIANSIANFYVQTMNGIVVASAALRSYDNRAELGKFCTLPKYRGKGLARDLATTMIHAAKRLGKSQVFALTTSSVVAEFFRSLGFSEVPRESLPEDWAKTYDFSRQSIALALTL